MQLIKTIVKLLLGKGVYRSYSQFGEDAVVGSMFRGKASGVYVDVGAYHPVLYSTTYALYKRGWSGVVIDPNKSMKSLFQIIRPRDFFVHCAVGKKSSSKTYYAYKDGSYNSLDSGQVRQLEITKKVSPVASYPISVRPLSDILEEARIEKIDYLNVDVEGMDHAVLETHNWNIRPKVISVEDALFNVDESGESPVFNLLKGKGYALKGIAGLTLIFRDTRLNRPA